MANIGIASLHVGLLAHFGWCTISNSHSGLWDYARTIVFVFFSFFFSVKMICIKKNNEKKSTCIFKNVLIYLHFPIFCESRTDDKLNQDKWNGINETIET